MDALRNCTTRFWAPVYPHHPMHVPCSLFRVSQIGGLGPNLTFQRDAKQLDEGFSIQSQNIILRRLNSRRMGTNSLMYQEFFLIFSLATFSKKKICKYFKTLSCQQISQKIWLANLNMQFLQVKQCICKESLKLMLRKVGICQQKLSDHLLNT